MGKLTDDSRGSGNFGRELAVGEQRTWHARDKHTGEITKTFTLTRTTRAYVYDLAEAYNAQLLPSASGAWYVANDELRFGDPRWRNEEQWRDCQQRNEEWLWDKRQTAEAAE